MKREGSILLIAVLLLFGFSSSVLAQVSFFQPPTYSGSGQVFVADFNGDGKPDILTSDGTLNLGNGDGTFTPGTKVSTTSGTIVAVADFNGDGKADVLEQGTGTLVVLLGSGNGTFQAPISTASGANLTPVAAIDLTGSGKADVVGVFNSSLFVYMSNGDGTFKSGVPYSLGTTPANAPMLTFGDFNGDGKIDIAVSIAGVDVAGEEAVFLGNGNGTFQTNPKTSTGVAYPFAALAGDFNGDGKLDLVLSSDAVCNPNCSTVSETYVLLGNGNGTFQAPTGVIPVAALSFAAADLNGDGNLDLVIGTYQMDEIYLGNGDGTFSNASNYVGVVSTYGGFGIPVLADFNLDGKLDIADGNSTLLGNGNGTFRGVPVGVVVQQSGTLGPAVVGAFEKKGVNDVAALWSGGSGTSVFYYVSILHNNGTGLLSLVHTYTLQQQGYAIVTADFNGDGNLDLAIFGEGADFQTWSISVLLGNGDGSFQSPLFYSQNVAPYSPTPSPRVMTVADFNNDRKPDLAIGGLSDSTIAVLLGNGDGSFSAPAYIYSGGNALTVVSADFNGDGNADISVGYSTPYPGGTALLFGNGNGTFQAAVVPTNLNGFVPELTADFNLDGNPDLLSASSVALGNGDDTFTVLPPVASSGLGEIDSFTDVADFNGDGIPDLIGVDNTYNGSCDAQLIALGNGDGTFGSPITFDAHNAPFCATEIAVDMNGDGLADLVFSWNNLALGVLINTNSAVPPRPSFSVSASDLSPNPIVAGSSAGSTITIAPLHGFTGNVVLSCTNPPTGISCSFSPASVSGGSGTSTLTMSTSASLSVGGSYTLVVSGTAENITRIAAISFTLQSGPPDFQISASGTSPATVAPGSSATSTVSVAPLNGFCSDVSLSCGSGTTGVTCSLSPAGVTPCGTGPAQTSPLTINTIAAVAPGAYPVTVTGTSGSDIHTTAVTLTVQAPTPDFTIGPTSGAQTSQTVNAGQSAKFVLSLAPTNSFSGTVNLSCGVTPAVSFAPTCTMSSSSMQISGSGTQSVTVTVATVASVTSVALPYGWPPFTIPLVWVLMLLGLGYLVLRSRKRIPIAAVVLGLAACLSCGGSSSSHTTTGTPAGTYTATVTATSSTLSHQIALHVLVQ